MTAKIDKITKIGDRAISICVECGNENYVDIFLDISIIEYNCKLNDRNIGIDIIDEIFEEDCESINQNYIIESYH